MKTEHASVCPLDCPDTCSLTVTVEDTRIVNIRGSKANPYTEAVICAKVPAAFPEFVHGSRRIRTPLKRAGAKGEDRFVPVSWEEALDTIYTRVSAIIAEHGPQAVMPFNYGGPHGFLAGGSMDLRFFHRLGASLLGVDTLEDSVLGQNARVVRDGEAHRALRLMIGDDCEVRL